jgi:hypothetical protein
MAVSRALRHLLRVRDLEEGQRRLALESAMNEQRRLENALAATSERARRGRRLVATSANTGELPDRLAGLEETRAAVRHAAVLTPRIADAELDVAALRQEYLAKRIERRQAETVIRETEAKEAIESSRRGQRTLDDWYLNRLQDAEHPKKESVTSGEARPEKPSAYSA